MTAKNDADRRSEELRKRKRSAVNRHMNQEHREALPEGSSWTDLMMGKTTVERMNLHYNLHEGKTSHEHKDLEDWREMERMNNDGEVK